MREHALHMTSSVILVSNPNFQQLKQIKYHYFIKNVVATPLS